MRVVWENTKNIESVESIVKRVSIRIPLFFRYLDKNVTKYSLLFAAHL